MKQQIIDSCCYFLFALVMGLSVYLALLWNEQSLISRLIYEGL